MKKKVFAIILCLISALYLCGCDSSSIGATSSPQTTSLESQAPTDTSQSPVQTATEAPTATEPPTQAATPTPTPSATTVTIPLQQKIKMTDAQRAGKVAYITIDDGPSKNTQAILQVLREKGVKATFFVLGKNAEKYPQYVKDIAASGCAIGNHSYSHIYTQIYATTDSLKDEIVHTNNILKSILGQDYQVTLFRFPGGLKQNDPAYEQVVYSLGMDFYAWSIDPQDSLGTKSTAAEIVKKFNSQLGSQKHPVILLHDADNKDTSVQALAIIIDELKAKGYSFDIIAKN